MECQCEHVSHVINDEEESNGCKQIDRIELVVTVYGSYKLCKTCREFGHMLI